MFVQKHTIIGNNSKVFIRYIDGRMKILQGIELINHYKSTNLQKGHKINTIFYLMCMGHGEYTNLRNPILNSLLLMPLDSSASSTCSQTH
jgi:hypothetical protein